MKFDKSNVTFNDVIFTNTSVIRDSHILIDRSLRTTFNKVKS